MVQRKYSENFHTKHYSSMSIENVSAASIFT